MDDIAIKILDTLFDLCEGEGYAILEEDEITSRISGHTFGPDELTEILESFSADGLADLKYAENRVYCIAMHTKGRNLIKQYRERLQRLIDENPEVIAYRDGIRAAQEDRAEREALEEERARLIREQERRLAEAQDSVEHASTSEERETSQAELARVQEENKEGQARVEEIDERIAAAEERERSRNTTLPSLARGYQAEATPVPPTTKTPSVRPNRAFFAALIGSAIGAAVVNVIFWIIFLLKYAK